MNRRTFIQALGVLAATPALGKYLNLFKSGGVREGITQAIDKGMDKGMDFYNLVIKKVVDEGTVIKEEDRFRTYTHPDRPDISVEVNVGTGDSAVYFDTDQGSKGFAEITSDIEMPKSGKELIEGEEVYKSMGPDGDYYKDVEEGEIRGGLTSLEEWIKMKRGYAAGGRVGMWKGGMPRGLMAALKTIRGKFGKGAIHQADEVVVDGEVYKITDKDRPPTPDEIESYMEDLHHGGELDVSDFGSTVRELDEAVAEAKAYEADMYQQYKRGDLEKYVKPEVLEESRALYQKKIDNVLETAYDEIAGGSGFTGSDYKYDAQILAESIAEQLGKVFDDMAVMQQNQIYEVALKRITSDMAKMKEMRKLSKPTQTLAGIKNTGTINISDPNVADEFARFMKESDPTGYKDLEQKVELSNFNPKGRKKNAHGGIIGLTNNPMTASSKAGVESLFERR
jgi:hypothetical protein